MTEIATAVSEEMEGRGGFGEPKVPASTVGVALPLWPDGGGGLGCRVDGKSVLENDR